jgi:hypothetical protein
MLRQWAATRSGSEVGAWLTANLAQRFQSAPAGLSARQTHFVFFTGVAFFEKSTPFL